MTLDQLLVVQQHDSALDRLAYQREHLPEIQALADCDEEQTHIDAQRAEVADARHELHRQQKRLEDEVALVEDRRTGENERLYSGTVTAHKDLQAIQDELEVLAKRQDQLEDQVLRLMEQGEPLDEQLAGFDTSLASVADRRSTIAAALVESQAQIDEKIANEQRARAAASAQVGAELLSEYEQVRAGAGGVGVARLAGKTCEGCHLQLSAVDYDRIRKEPADAVVRCTECGRILVR